MSVTCAVPFQIATSTPQLATPANHIKPSINHFVGNSASPLEDNPTPQAPLLELPQSASVSIEAVALHPVAINTAVPTVETKATPLQIANDPLLSSNSILFIMAVDFLSDICGLSQNFHKWQTVFANDFDKVFLLDGIKNGFRLINIPIEYVLPADSSNYRSALTTEAKPFLDKLFSEELKAHKISRRQTKPLRIQSIGAVSKRDTSAFRPITDCSRPHANSLNSYIEAECFKFETVDDALLLSTPGCFYSLVDIKAAYRAVPVFPPHRQLQGFRWKFDWDRTEHYFVDNFLCFGLANAPAIFNRISTAIARFLRLKNHIVVVYLDDFLLIGSTYARCRESQNALLNLLQSLGFPICWEKLAAPAQRVQFLGIIIDSVHCRLELPQEKVQSFHFTLQGFRNQRCQSSSCNVYVVIFHLPQKLYKAHLPLLGYSSTR